MNRDPDGSESTSKQGNPGKYVCQICGSADRSRLRAGVILRPAVSEFIRKDFGQWNEQGWICESDLQKYRSRYVEELIEKEKGELTALERKVLNSIKEQDILSTNPVEDADMERTFGERLADGIANFGGSWVFISIFCAVVLGWMVLNSLLLIAHPFDPYPYILLNLVLSCLAAIQAPIIMMSQNRQEERDRLRAAHDYQVNLKAELEVRHLHQKIDHIMSHQWELLIEIQDVQREFFDALRAERAQRKQPPGSPGNE